MGLLDKLLGKDPTTEWPAFNGRTPAMEVERGAFGPLKFGDSLDKARAIGRPSVFKGNPAKNCELIYDAGGFVLFFKEGRFEAAMFTTATDEDEGRRPGAVPASLVLGGLPIDVSTTPQAVREWFGEVEKEIERDDYLDLAFVRSLEFTKQQVAICFEWKKSTGLSVVDVYVDD